MPPTSQTALTSIDPGAYGLPTAPVQNAAHAANALQTALQHGCNVLAPMTQISFIPHGYAVSLRVVTFDGAFTEAQRKAKSNGTFYITDEGKLALHRTALDQLAAAAGISWVGRDCGRVDDGQEVYFWRYRMTARYRGFDSTPREISREYELDLRDGSPAAGKAGNGLRNARIYGASLCESKAANRVVRAALGLRAYTEQEAARPFVFPALVWMPAPSPEIDRMIAAKELGLVQEVFGPGLGGLTGGQAPMLAEPGRVIEGQAEQVGAQPGQRALPAPQARRDFAAENARLNQRQTADRAEAAAEGGGLAEAPPWAQRKPAADTSCAGRSWENALAYCEAKDWNVPTDDQQRQQLREHVNGAGREDFLGFCRSVLDGVR